MQIKISFNQLFINNQTCLYITLKMKQNNIRCEDIRRNVQGDDQGNASFTTYRSNEIAMHNQDLQEISRDLQDISLDLEDIDLASNLMQKSQLLNNFNTAGRIDSERYVNLKKLIATSNQPNALNNSQKLNEENLKIFGDKTDYKKYTEYLKADKKKSEEKFSTMYLQIQQESLKQKFKKKNNTQDQFEGYQMKDKNIKPSNDQLYKVFSLEFGLASVSENLEDGKIDLDDMLDFISDEKQTVKKNRRKRVEKNISCLQTIKEERTHHLQDSESENKIRAISSNFEDLKFRFDSMLTQLKQQEQEQNHIQRQLSKIQNEYLKKSQAKSSIYSLKTNNKQSPQTNNKQSPQKLLGLQTKYSPQYINSQIISGLNKTKLQYSQEKKSLTTSRMSQIQLKLKQLQSHIQQVSQQQKQQNQQIKDFMSKIQFQQIRRNINLEQHAKNLLRKTQCYKSSIKLKDQKIKHQIERSRTLSGLTPHTPFIENLQTTVVNTNMQNATTRQQYKSSYQQIRKKKTILNYDSPFQVQFSKLKQQQIHNQNKLKHIRTQVASRKTSYNRFHESYVTQILPFKRDTQEKTIIQQNYPIRKSDFVYMNHEISINTHFIKHNDVFKPVQAEVTIKNNCNFDIEDVLTSVYGPKNSNLLVLPKRNLYKSLKQSQQKKFRVWFTPQAVEDRGFHLQINYVRCGIRKKSSVKVNLPIIGFILETHKCSEREFLEKFNNEKKNIYVAPKKLKVNQIRWYEQTKSKFPLKRINITEDRQNLIYGLVLKYWSYPSLIYLKIVCMPEGKIALCLRTENEIHQNEQFEILQLIDEVLFGQ